MIEISPRWCKFSVLALSVVQIVHDLFDLRSRQTADYEIGICCPSAKHASLTRTKPACHRIRIMCPIEETCLPVYCYFLSEKKHFTDHFCILSNLCLEYSSSGLFSKFLYTCILISCEPDVKLLCYWACDLFSFIASVEDLYSVAYSMG